LGWCWLGCDGRLGVGEGGSLGKISYLGPWGRVSLGNRFGGWVLVIVMCSLI
jgi:hypothetical protein